MVLQNGEDLITVELRFGFGMKKTFAISAAGWSRSKVGWEGNSVMVSNVVEIGLQLPKVPGLSSIMEFFVKSYGSDSTNSCAVALAQGADRVLRLLPTAKETPEA